MVTGISEILVVLVLVMVFFGAGKVPQIMGAVGASVKTFKDAASGEPEDDKDKPQT